jgi:hypothetical protein
LRTESLNQTDCSYLINRTHPIVLMVVLRHQRGYLFLHTFFLFAFSGSTLIIRLCYSFKWNYKENAVGLITNIYQGWIQYFKLGEAHLKKLHRAEGGTNIFGVFRVKNQDFTPKNHIFSNCGGRRENCWGISCEKSRFYAKNLYYFRPCIHYANLHNNRQLCK